jgi:hypothetical protein
MSALLLWGMPQFLLSSSNKKPAKQLNARMFVKEFSKAKPYNQRLVRQSLIEICLNYGNPSR